MWNTIQSVAMQTFKHLLAALDYAVTLDQVEARIAPDQSLYFINLTADEARKIRRLDR